MIKKLALAGLAALALVGVGGGVAQATEPTTEPDATPLTVRAFGDPFEIRVLNANGDGFRRVVVPGLDQWIPTDHGGWASIEFLYQGRHVATYPLTNPDLPTWCDARSGGPFPTVSCGVVA
jgi:hypothetical protein